MRRIIIACAVLLVLLAACAPRAPVEQEPQSQQITDADTAALEVTEPSVSESEIDDLGADIDYVAEIE